MGGEIQRSYIDRVRRSAGIGDQIAAAEADSARGSRTGVPTNGIVSCSGSGNPAVDQAHGDRGEPRSAGKSPSRDGFHDGSRIYTDTTNGGCHEH